MPTAKARYNVPHMMVCKAITYTYPYFLPMKHVKEHRKQKNRMQNTLACLLLVNRKMAIMSVVLLNISPDYQ